MEPRVHPHQALAVYVEPLVGGRSVVAFTEPDTGLAERLEEMGADAVVLVTPDDDLEEVSAARFDVAIVADLARFEEPAAVVAVVRQMVGEEGVALIAAANREAGDSAEGALDYYALFDLVAGEFSDVRMVAQLAFHGVALAEVGGEDESPAVSVDTQLADPDRTPEAFVAVASERGASLDPYAIVQLSAPEPLEAEPVDTAELEALEKELVDTRRAAQSFESELVETRRVAQSFERELVETQRAAQALAARLQVVEARALQTVELERELAVRARQLSELSTAVEEMRSAAEAGRIAAAQVETLALRAERAERALAQAEPEITRTAEAHAAELHRYEEALRERAQAVRSLEAEVGRRERMVRELVAAVDEHALVSHAVEPATAPGFEPPVVAPPPPPPPPEESPAVAVLAEDNARLQQKLDALALELARREADAQASAWTIAELERKALDVAKRLPVAPASPPPSAELLAEVDALRRALTQEHEARVQAESGEELVRARAEIQRQAALLVQLGKNSEGPEELR